MRSDKPPSAREIEILKSKAMLLLRREQEVCTLRQERGRLEAWLATVHRLSHDLQHKHVERLAEDSVDALVNVMMFQLAAVYRYSPRAERFALVSGKGHDHPAATLDLPVPDDAYLRQHRSGLYSPGDKRPELAALARETGLGRFFWYLLEPRAGAFLLVAGFASQSAAHGLMSLADLDHFELFANHLSTLLNNAGLIEALDQEKAELSEANALLDESLGKLRESQAQVAESTRQLADVSRRAGMADIATGVLHNVGNALNSVNVSTSMARERLKALSPARLSQVAELVSGDSQPGERQDPLSSEQRDKISRYLLELSRHWQDEQMALLAELQTSRESIDHIKSIVTKQQAYAKTVGVSELLDVARLMEDAISFVQAPLAQLGVRIQRQYTPMNEVMLDRHKVLQILVNLVSNAKHALSASPNHDRILVARVREAATGQLELSVEDNGIGVADEHRDRLFAHGFTTKLNGHGFGLHTSALAAREMGGQLSFESAGRGQGARFTLTVPVVEQVEQSPKATHDAA